jgi:quinol monooxygenase YgiN
MAVIAIAEIFGVPAVRRQLTELLARTEAHVRGLPGVRRYVFASTLDEPDHYVLVSEWDSREAMAAYYRSDEFARYQHDVHDLLARDSEMTVYDVTEGVRPVRTGELDPRDAD